MQIDLQRFSVLVEVINEDQTASQRFDLISAAFTAWLVLRAFGTKVSFDKYCKGLGLIEDNQTPEEKEALRKLEISRALANAEKIIELDKHRLRRNNG